MDNRQVTSPLRSSLQFAGLEHKLRLLAQKSSDPTGLIKAVAGPPLIKYELAKARLWEGSVPDESRLANCLDVVTRPARPLTELCQADLLGFQALLAGDATQQGQFRRGTGTRIADSHACLDPVAVPRAMARFFEWTASEAFSQMHAIEQMTLCQVRLYEIWPFEVYSSLAADFFSLRVLYLRASVLPLLSDQETGNFLAAVSDAFRFATKPLVDFHLRACEHACEEALGLLSAQPPRG